MRPHGVWRRWRRALLTALALAAFATTFAAGWFAHARRQESNGQLWHPIREQGATPWRFINPLLECAANEDLIRQPEFVSFKRELTALVDSHRKTGEIAQGSIYFLQLHDGLSVSVNRRIAYLPASLLKLPTLLAVLKRSESDHSFLAQRVVFPGLRDDNRLLAFPPAETLVPGASYSIEELCRRMLRYSDNNATGLLNSIVPVPEQQQALLGLGVLPELVAKEGRLGIKAVSSFLRVLYNASYLSREGSELALEMLSDSSFRDGIIAGLPQGVPVCSKYAEATTAADARQLHEFAIVYHKSGPYLLGVMAEGSDFPSLARFIRDTSRFVFEEVGKQSVHLDGDALFGDAPNGRPGN